MTFLAEVNSSFTELLDEYLDFFQETLEEHIASTDLMTAYIKTLKKLSISCDSSEIRTSIDPERNPGPHILIALSLLIDEVQFSLLPGLGSEGGSETTSVLGIVASGIDRDTPNHLLGFRIFVRENPQQLPYEMTWEKTKFIGDFPTIPSLKGFTPELSRNLVGSFLEFLSHAFGYATLASGLLAFEKESKKTEAAIKAMWKEFIETLEGIVSDLE
jgi:hypothetical protein